LTATLTSENPKVEQDLSQPPAGGRARGWVKHVVAIGIGMVFACVIVELCLRTIIGVTDVPLVRPDPVIGWTRIPGQTGWYIKDTIDAIRAPYHFNQAGFNSPHEYTTTKRPGVRRVAVVGDSFVEALEVAPDASLTAVIERTLNDEDVKAEAYNFGRSGMGTSQEFFMIRDTVLNYDPDAVVLLFIDNDMVDSCAFLADDATVSYVDVGENGRMRLIEPRRAFEVNPVKRLASSLAIVRYLYAQRNVEHLWNRLLSGGEKRNTNDPFDGVFPPFYTGSDDEARRAWKVVETALVGMKQLCDERKIAFLLAYGPSHRATRPDRYPPIDNALCDPQLPRRRLADIAERNNIAFLDLFEPLVADGKQNGRDHYFMGDGHWNEAGHEVAGVTIAERLQEQFSPSDPL